MTGFRDAVRHPWLVRGAQVAIGILFISAALPKVGDPAAFAASVHNYRLAPASSEHFVAMTLPWIELVAGLSLVLGVSRRAGAVVTVGLMVLFTGVVAQAWLRGLDFECGCFGTADATRVGAKKLLENVGFLAVALLAATGPADGNPEEESGLRPARRAG